MQQGGFDLSGLFSSISDKLFQMSGWMQIIVIAAGVVFAGVAFILYESGSELNHKAKKWLVSILFACAGVVLAKPIIQGLSSFFSSISGSGF